MCHAPLSRVAEGFGEDRWNQATSTSVIETVHRTPLSVFRQIDGERNSIERTARRLAGRLVFERHRTDRLRIRVELTDEVLASGRGAVQRLEVARVVRRLL
jgi:hypothetical protein